VSRQITKVAIGIEGGGGVTSEKVETKVSLRCWMCGPISIERNQSLNAFIDTLIRAPSAQEQGELQAWQEELIPCSHCEQITQTSSNIHLVNRCMKCHLEANLWLCLTCGHVGCGRRQYGGIGGNEHAANHYEETHHPIACKLGTITPEGTAGRCYRTMTLPFPMCVYHSLLIDVYCYKCGETRLDPLISQHLDRFGINISTQAKTEKSITELVSA
jgi:ubiquitin carboxyl-terminal hydrolase 5/13